MLLVVWLVRVRVVAFDGRSQSWQILPMQKTPEKTGSALSPKGPEPGAASGSRAAAGLRGKDLAEQEALLAPAEAQASGNKMVFRGMKDGRATRSRGGREATRSKAGRRHPAHGGRQCRAGNRWDVDSAR